MSTEYEHPSRLRLFSPIILTALMAFIGTSVIAFFPALVAKRENPLNLLILTVGFFIYIILTAQTVLHLLAQFIEQSYDLQSKEAAKLSLYLLAGLPEDSSERPVLRIQEGKTLSDNPQVMYMDKVGGPGYFSIAHDSAVVTSRMGKLQRVLGPGFHHADSFEKVWDVIDLRPQRSSLRVEFMTTDGIPAYCDAEIRFQVASSSITSDTWYAEASPVQPYSFDPEVILKLATSKYVKCREGTDRIQDWRTMLVNDTLDNIIRDTLEKYSLDHFFSPGDQALENEKAIDKASPPPEKSIEIVEIQARIEEAIRRVAAERGIVVDMFQLSPVYPVEQLESTEASIQHTVPSSLSTSLYQQCRNAFLTCHEFTTDAATRALFVTEELEPFQAKLPESTDKAGRVVSYIEYLMKCQLADGRWGLLLFVIELARHYDPKNAQHHILRELAEELQAYFEEQSS